jgi:hypothetical protein
MDALPEGLIAVTWSRGGARTLESLADHRSDQPGVVVCCRIEGTKDGSLGQYQWSRYSPRQGWALGGPEPAISSAAAGLEAAIQESVRLSLGVRPSTPSVLHLAFILEEGEDPVQSPLTEFAAALPGLRNRYQSRIGLAVVVAPGRYQGIPGHLDNLPTPPGADGAKPGSPFEVVLLMDRLNADQCALENEQWERASAEVLAHVTIEPTAPALRKRLLSEISARGGAVAVALGVANFRLDSHELRAHLANYEHRVLMARTWGNEEDPAAPNLPNDEWLSRVVNLIETAEDGWLVKTQEDLAVILERLEYEGLRELATWVTSGTSNARQWEMFLSRRNKRLQEAANIRSWHLASFMEQRFVTWYLDDQLGRLRQTSQTETHDWEEPIPGAIAMLVASLVVMLLGVLGGLVFPLLFLLAAAGLGGLVLVLMRGFSRTRTSQTTHAVRRIDLIPELKEHRLKVSVARRLAGWNQQLIDSFEKHKLELENEGSEQASTAEWGFPVTDRLCELLRKSSEAINSDVTAPDLTMAAVAGSTPEEHWKSWSKIAWQAAYKQTKWVGSLSFARLIEILGGVDSELFSEIVATAVRQSRPLIPVEGTDCWTLVAVPESLPDSLRRALVLRVPGESFIAGWDGEGIILVQWYGGYTKLQQATREPSAGQGAQPKQGRSKSAPGPKRTRRQGSSPNAKSAKNPNRTPPEPNSADAERSD